MKIITTLLLSGLLLYSVCTTADTVTQDMFIEQMVTQHGFDKVYAIADEDMDRNRDEKTSAVHFMRFELTTDMSKAVKEKKDISMGIDYDGFEQLVNPITEASRASLMNDLQ